MIRKIKIVKISDTLDVNDFNSDQILFRETQKDTIGNSGSNPTWGNVFVKNKNGEIAFVGVGLYKELDYDFPNNAYSEKIFSIIGKEVLPGVRLPNIDVVEEGHGQHGAISYRILDNDTEDLIHVRDILFNKYDRTAMLARKSFYTLDDILECMKIQIPDRENYRKVERDVIHTLLLDAVTNNSDRHPNNWALVRNKQTNRYDLAIYDNSAAFVDMFESSPWQTMHGWTGTYIAPDDDLSNRRGYLGKDFLKLIEQRYPYYYEEFSERLSEKMPIIAQKILAENLPVNNNRIIQKIESRSRYMQETVLEGDLDYE